MNRRKHLVLYWASSKTINLTYLHAELESCSWWSLLAFLCSDTKKGSKPDRKNQAQAWYEPHDRRTWNYASLKIKVKIKMVSRHPLLVGLYKNIPGSTQTLFWLHNKAHPLTPTPERVSTACAQNTNIHMEQLYFWVICISNQRVVCQFGWFWWMNLFHCLARTKELWIARKHGGISAHSVCRWAALGGHNSLFCRVEGLIITHVWHGKNTEQQSGNTQSCYSELHITTSFSLLIFWETAFINTYNLFSHSHVFLPCFDSDVTLCGF